MPMNEMDLLDNLEYKLGYDAGFKDGKSQQKIADEYCFKIIKNSMYGMFAKNIPEAIWERPNPTTPKSYTRICSRCKGTAYVIGGAEYPRCPWCGALMRGGYNNAQTQR